MGRKPHRYKLLLDENFFSRNRLPILNRRYNTKHIKHDFNLIGLKDPAVYRLAVEQGRIIITFNDKDFLETATKSKKSGIIGVSTNMLSDNIDKKIAAKLRRAKKSEIYGKFNYISNETEV